MTTPATLLAQSIPSLPAPPALGHYLFENPWPAVIALAFGALAAGAVVNRRAGARRAWPVAGGLLLLALAAGVTARLVTTTREALIRRSQALVDAAARADTAALSGMLADDAELRAAFLTSPWARGRLLDGVRQYLGQRYPIQSHREDSASAAIDGPNAARTQLRVVVRARDATMYDVPVASWWRLEWRRDADGQWRIRGLECLWLSAVPAGTKIAP